MKFVASMLIRNERARYLDLTIPALLDFCDAVYVLDDGSDDGSAQLAHELGAVVKLHERSTFFKHEGDTRQALYNWTMKAEPSHVLQIDADEFVGDGLYLRRALEQNPDERVWILWLDEVWRAEPDCLCVRVDGSWGNRAVPLLYATPPGSESWQIASRPLACGREPVEVSAWPHPVRMETEILHFGWTREEERVARHARYAAHDKGRYHASHHLDSILWPNTRVELGGRDWPPGLLPYREALLERVNVST